MAISFVDDDVQDSAAAQSLTFTVPAGTTTDDFMIAFVKQSENTGQQTWDDDGGGGNGWTREAYNRSTAGRDQETAVYWKVATSGSESNPTFTWNSGGTNEQMSGSLLVYRGVDTVTPFAGSIGFLSATDDANPPNPSVSADFANSWVVCFHAATHDDITTVAAPTGFTLRTQVWNGTSNDHRNHFTADISGIGAGNYTPPDWQHSVANTTPEYHTYSVCLNEVQPIGIATFDDELSWTDTNKTVTGYGFEATQNTGKLEFWSDITGTIKSVQTIDSWSDTSIQYDLVQGGLSDNVFNYLVVTNDSGDVSGANAVAFGLLPYSTIINEINPDHLWSLDGNYNDTGVGGSTRNMTNGIVGTHPFVTNISEDATQAMHFDGVLDRREIQDSPYMNITINSKERTVAGWIQLGGIQQSLGAIWKEGGGIQNLAFITGIGNVLTAQLADLAGTRDQVQAFGDFRLEANRPYHICMRYTHLETVKEMVLFIDGEEQSVTDGNPMTLGIFDTHSGDVTWGDPDNNLETGGTDIAYSGQEDCVYQYWCSWSDNSVQTGALDKVTEIRDKLFRRGALPKYTIDTDTQANMQIALDALGTLEVENYPIGIRIQEVSGGGTLSLTATNITFNQGITLELEWRGTGTLEWTVGTGSNLNDSKLYSSNLGSITIVRPSTLTVGGLVIGGELRIYDDDVGGNDFGLELSGVESLVGTTYQYSHDGTINDILIQFMSDGYVEIVQPHQLDNTDQTVTLNLTEDTN